MRLRFGTMSLLVTYLVTSLIVLVLPLTAVGVIWYQDATSRVFEEIVQMNRERLERSTQELERLFLELRNTSILMGVNRRLRRRYIEENPIQTLEAIDELRHFARREAALSLIALTFIEDDAIYTPEARFDELFFLERELKVPRDQKVILQRLFREPSAPRVVTGLEIGVGSGTMEPMLIYTHPIAAVTTANPTAAVCYFIARSSLKDQLLRIAGPLDGSLTITDQSGNQVLKMSYVADTSEGPAVNNGETVDTILEAATQFPPFNYRLAIPQPEFIGRLSQLRRTILSTMAVILLAGIGLAAFLSYRNYRPIRRLAVIAKEKDASTVQRSSDRERHNELESISLALFHAYDRSEELEELVHTQEEAVIQDLLSSLLKREPRSPDFYQMEASGIPQSVRGCVVSVVTLLSKRRQGIISDRERLLTVISGIRKERWRLYAVELLYREALAVIAVCPQVPDSGTSTGEIDERLLDNPPRDEAREEIGRTLLGVCRSDGIEVMVAMGGQYPDWNGAHASFLDALSVLDRTGTSTSHHLVLYEPSPDTAAAQFHGIWFPGESLERLTRSLRLRSKDLSERSLDELMKIVNEQSLSPVMRRAVCHEIANSAVKTLIEVFDSLSPESFGPILAADTTAELGDALHSILVTQDFDRSESGTEDAAMVMQVECFFRDNFLDPNFSLVTLSDEFQVSIYYMSRFFQRRLGVKFSDYLQRLRIAEAERLLMSTGQTVRDIAHAVCYQNSSHFIRSFKSIHGITPAEFRKKNE